MKTLELGITPAIPSGGTFGRCRLMRPISTLFGQHSLMLGGYAGIGVMITRGLVGDNPEK
eukprot:1185540-Prorocentrum_minimum.AAC.4